MEKVILHKKIIIMKILIYPNLTSVLVKNSKMTNHRQSTLNKILLFQEIRRTSKSKWSLKKTILHLSRYLMTSPWQQEEEQNIKIKKMMINKTNNLMMMRKKTKRN